MEVVALRTFEKVSSTIRSIYKLRTHRIHKFKPKIEVHHEVGPFVLKTVSSVQELKEALQLRFQVFYHEMIGVKAETGIDIDEYDVQCDHLIIVEKKTGRIVGTYRLNCSLFTENFYSAREFNLNRLHRQEGIKLELGRACIHKNYRRGVVISMLWRGIAEYMVASKSQFLFGCASVKTANPREAALLYSYFLQDKRYTSEYFCPPTLAFKMPELESWIQNFSRPLSEPETEEALALVPPLFRAYLKIGCYLGGEPAWDEEFGCIDFLTILHKEDLNGSLWKKYKLDFGSSIES